MTTLYLMRHGIAEDDYDIADEDRQLTGEGRRKVETVAGGLATLGVKPDLVLASPLVRAQQTAAIVVAVLAPKLGVETCTGLRNGTEPEDLLAELAAHRGMQHVFLIGHQPSLGELASHLLTGSALIAPLPFKKAAVAAIGVGALPPRARGELRWFAPSRMLGGIHLESR